MRIPDPKANTTTEAYLAYKAGYLEESELKPVLYKPDWHFDGWLAYWAGLTETYPVKNVGKNLFDKDNANILVSYFDSSVTTITADSRNRTIFIPCLSNTTYTVSKIASPSPRSIGYTEVIPTDGVQVYGITDIARDGTTGTITTGASAKYLAVRLWSSSQDTSTTLEQMLGSVQIEQGSSASPYEPYTGEPEMLCDEEALVAYLSGVTDTYPQEIKDPYDVRITGYLRYLVSARWGRPDYPVNNEEFYLSTMKPPVVPSGDTPSSDIEMDDTAEAPFIDLKMYGDTSQTTYTGKNLISTINNAGEVEITGLNSFIANKDTARTVNIYFASRLPAGTYTISYDVEKNTANTDGIRCGIFVVNESGTGTTSLVNIPSPYFGHIEYTFTSTTQVDRLYFYINNEMPSGSTATVTNLQVEAGSSATSFEPYVGGIPAPNPDYPQNVNVVTGRQVVAVTGEGGESADYEINLGKNLLRFTNENVIPNAGSIGFLNVDLDDNDITLACVNDFSGTQYVYYYTQELDASTEYTLSCLMKKNAGLQSTRVSFSYSDNGTSWADNTIEGFNLEPGQEQAYTKTFSGHKFYRFGFYNCISSGVSAGGSVSYKNAQIELGSTATPYASYFEPIELCKIGDYQDYIYKNGDDWYLHKACGKLVLNGSEADWTFSSSSAYPFRLAIANGDNFAASQDVSPIVFTNYYTPFAWNTPADDRPNYGITTYLRTGEPTNVATFRNIDITSLEDWKAWLSEHNTTLYYPLATITDAQITSSELITQLDALMEGGSYEGKTYIKVTATDPNLPGLLYVEAGKYD